MKDREWIKIAVHKNLINVTITESFHRSDDRIRRFTATIHGWRNWKLYEDRMYANTFGKVIQKTKEIRERIEAGDKSVFMEDTGIKN